MDRLLDAALDAGARPGIRRVEVRILSPSRFEHLSVRNGEATSLTSSEQYGVGVRALGRGGYGFAATESLDRASVRAASARAARLALSAARSSKSSVEIVDERPVQDGRYSTRLKLDPFETPLEEKLELLVEAERALHVDPAVKSGHASFEAWHDRKWYADSDGGRYRSSIVHVGAGMDATAAGGGEVQRRSSPNSFGGDYAQAGWEFVRALGLAERAPTVGREAVALLSAPPMKSGTMTVVLGSDQLALQVHESVGHATELDRILGMEAGFAGTSFLSVEDRGTLRYGSEGMTIVADATRPGALGTFGWDDEGVPARRTTLVDRGRLAGFLTSRETAARIGLPRSGGTVRGDGAARTPMIRMTNIDLLPGDRSFDELLEGVEDGLFVTTNRSWSIDDQRLNFQFGTEVGWRIRHGELAGLVRNPIYAGMTPAFWGSMDAVGNRATWHSWGLPNCGKGQPSQGGRVAHGAPAARFRRVAVRGGR